jgi:ring-1,2-phenylacetyl-CoA epoxidase subunit PaaD
VVSGVSSGREQQAWRALAAVPDPEIPVISILDLGIVRAIEASDSDDALDVTLTPTYSGCPATEVIEASVREALQPLAAAVRIHRRLAPAWTTDWISDEGQRKLRDYGIAPPGQAAHSAIVNVVRRNVPCPRCGSANTERLAAFGSTACKALHRCLACLEPFDHFKPI